MRSITDSLDIPLRAKVFIAHLTLSVTATATAASLRFRHRLARNHLCPRGRVVDEPRLNRRGLFQVVWLQAVIDVHVGVVRARAILQRILNELEGGQPHVSNGTWSVLPVARMVSVDAPISRNGSSHARKIGSTILLSCM